MSLQPAPPNPPPTFPTHVDWCVDASMSGSLVPTHTNDAPRHPTARMQHQTSPPALLDGTGLIQMPLQRAESPEAKQDNCIKWKHMRNMRSQQRHHEPNETPRLNATHKHQRRSNNAPLTRPYPSPQHDGHILHHRGTKQNLRNIPESSIAYTRRLNCFIPEGSIVHTRRLNCIIPEGSIVVTPLPTLSTLSTCPLDASRR